MITKQLSIKLSKMRGRKTKTELNNNHVANGAVKNVKKDRKKTNQNNQQMLVNVLLGFLGVIFACGVFLFITRDLVPEYERNPFERTKTEVPVENKRNGDASSKINNHKNSANNQKNSIKEQHIQDDIFKQNPHETQDTIEKPEEVSSTGWREADQRVIAKYDSTICNIEKRKIEELSSEEFEKVYRYKKPVIVTFPNGANDWADADKWTVSNLKREYGDFRIYSGNAREIVRRGGNGEVGSSFSDFVDKLIQEEDETGEPLYVFDRNFYNSSTLPKTLKPPNIFKIQNGVDDSIFFLGASRSGVSFHKHADSWNGVLYGRKRWFLYPIDHTPPGGVFTGYTMLEWFDMIYPKIKAEVDKPIECVQRAGEILYLPEGFYHGTINIGDTVAIGIQKKESTLGIQKLFYEDRYLGQMLANSKSSQERTEWSRKFIELYTTILELLPESTEVMQNIAELLTYVDRQRASLDMVNKVLKIDPYFLMAILHKAELMMDMNEVYKAEELLQEALQLNPELFDTRVKYGRLLYDTGRPEEAVFHFRKATELRPNDIQFWNYLKNAQIASEDDRGAEESDEIILYLKSFED
ncbi:uncharacterized protein LOC127714471 [Mytilus californianus]|uniref:uncharacterized protein LOC127714471 n=1 Tax=Mytilus californianus TaxID=6549 RepID=UPI0022481EF3|nr:uncharacterized protein LOC127714471 [Mytilus californianus]